tara:strand:- start:800 stop:1636 length:837 start_codon:yes stop_codon:yes gene_type:complete
VNLERILKQYFASSTHVAEITKPLESLGIVGFFYARLYPDGSMANLTSQPEWSEHCFKQLFSGHYQAQDTTDYCHQYPGISLSALNPHNFVWQDAREHFGYGNSISFCDDNTHFREISCFYSTADNHAINQTYLNELDILKKFKHYFIGQSATLIQEANRNKVLLPEIILEEKNRLSQPDVQAVSLSSARLQKISSSDRKICLLHKNTQQPIYLSSQQGRCLVYLMQGKSAKEIARIMGLSHRTVEYYLTIIRKQLGCNSSKELILSYAHQVLPQTII